MELNKDFLSDVLGCKIRKDIGGDSIKYNNEQLIRIMRDYSYDFEVNKYELMHRIKEWVKDKFNNGIYSGWNKKGKGYKANMHFLNKPTQSFEYPTEFEAVYKAGLYLWEKDNE
ncbi:hypothetical protein [Francisella marina]|uniref:Uncharacterized protein n=1 Tax=Francisella marina TaxID=2249302 RepID=A0ABX5ZHX4_9GAMM|nr:hypothetical protein [Francisella marina]QEO57599.1 hypothetical protein F0R74_06930 [Francisella marina]QEO58286.1 hypothetical protein F0R75_00310 [Francisella marina]